MEKPNEESVRIETNEVGDPHHLRLCKITYEELKGRVGDGTGVIAIDWRVGGATYCIPEEVWKNVLLQGAEIKKGDYKKGQMPEPVITLDQCYLKE